MFLLAIASSFTPVEWPSSLHVADKSADMVASVTSLGGGGEQGIDGGYCVYEIDGSVDGMALIHNSLVPIQCSRGE